MDASIIFINGNIVTMDNGMIAEALAVEKDRILYVGENEDVMMYNANDTILVDLKGKTIIPGFNAVDNIKRIGEILGEAANNSNLHIYELLELLISKDCENMDRGRIREGFIADILILDSNPLVVSNDMLEYIKVDSAYVDGKLVYENNR